MSEAIPLNAMKCYYDGSAGGRSDEWLGLGGFVATDQTWAKFRKDWDLMLKSRNPPAPYLHMGDLLTGNGPFTTEAGWNEERERRLVLDAAGVLASMDQAKVCGVVCAVDTLAHKRLLGQGYVISKPAIICAEIGIYHLLTWYMDRHKFELAYLFYDQGEEFIKSIRTRWLKEEQKRKRIKEGFWAMVANVRPLNMRDTPGIQAADLLAWAFVRRLRNDESDEWSKLATQLIGSRTCGPGVVTATQLDPIDEPFMRRKYLTRRSE